MNVTYTGKDFNWYMSKIKTAATEHQRAKEAEVEDAKAAWVLQESVVNEFVREWFNQLRMEGIADTRGIVWSSKYRELVDSWRDLPSNIKKYVERPVFGFGTDHLKQSDINVRLDLNPLKESLAGINNIIVQAEDYLKLAVGGDSVTLGETNVIFMSDNIKKFGIKSPYWTVPKLEEQ